MAISEKVKPLSFEETLHQNGGKFEHPYLTRRQQEAEAISTSNVDSEATLGVRAKDVIERFPMLGLEPPDQGLIVTPYDSYEGMEVAIPPEELIEGWHKLWRFNLELANHPSRMEALRQLEAEGFTPPGRQEGVIDYILAGGVLPQLSDLGHNVDVNDGHRDQPQAHRTRLLENGPFSFTTKRRGGSYVGLGAMPDVNGSVLMLTTAAKMHMRAEVPEVGVFSDRQRQAQLARRVIDRLTAEDELLEERSEEEKIFIKDHWIRNVIGVLEVDEEKAKKRAWELYRVGVRSFRVYGHSVGSEVVGTVKALREVFGPDIEIYASQITNEYNAKKCAEAGADAIIIGVGSGGRCTTAEKSQLIPSNATLAWKLRDLEIPVIGEGGAVDEVVISILTGMSGVNGSGSVGGGTFEAPGGIFYLTKDGKTFVKPYGGEASARTKWLSQRVYPTGIPYFSEGEQSFKALTSLEESMTQKVMNHWERIILGAVIMGVDEGPLTIPAMQKKPTPLYEKSPTTQYLQRTH